MCESNTNTTASIDAILTIVKMTSSEPNTTSFLLETTDAEKERSEIYVRNVQFLAFVDALRKSNDVVKSLNDFAANEASLQQLLDPKYPKQTPLIKPQQILRYCFTKMPWSRAIETTLSVTGWRYSTPVIFPCLHISDDLFTRTTESGFCEHVEHGKLNGTDDVAIVNAENNESRARILYLIRLTHTVHPNGGNRPPIGRKRAHLINLTCHDLDGHLVVFSRSAKHVVNHRREPWGEALSARMDELSYTKVSGCGDAHDVGTMFNGLLLLEDVIKMAYSANKNALFYNMHRQTIVIDGWHEAFIIGFAAESVFSAIFDTEKH